MRRTKDRISLSFAGHRYDSKTKGFRVGAKDYGPITPCIETNTATKTMMIIIVIKLYLHYLYHLTIGIIFSKSDR